MLFGIYLPVVVKSWTGILSTLKIKKLDHCHIDADNFTYVQDRQIPKVTTKSPPCYALNGVPYMVFRYVFIYLQLFKVWL